MDLEKLHLAIRVYLDRKRNRIVGGILHAYDSNKDSEFFKHLVKTSLLEFTKDVLDLCMGLAVGNAMILNPEAEQIRKEVEKVAARAGVSGSEKHKKSK